MTRLPLIALLALTASLATLPAHAGDPMQFWDRPRHGANGFSAAVDSTWWRAAADAGIEFVRLAPNKWTTRGRDFLLGDADRYVAPDDRDVAALHAALDDAERAGVRVVLTTLSLPGSRWRQQNGEKVDLRLWRDPAQLERAAALWGELARRLAGHPALVGYDVLNEPIPDRAEPESAAVRLTRFHARMVSAIRAADVTTPIVLESAGYASASHFESLAASDDPRVLYSFHCYDPYEYTNRRENGGKVRYPGPLTLGERTVRLAAAALDSIVRPVADWARAHHVAPNRILCGEFGCNRTVPGAERYLADLIGALDRHGWHWAFYSFREDTWDGMDYELGSRPPGAAYWDAVARGEHPTLPRITNPAWSAIRSRLTP